LLTASDNVKKRNDEYGNPTRSKKILVKNLETNEVFRVESVREASRMLNVARGSIKKYLRNELKRKPKHNYSFCYDKRS